MVNQTSGTFFDGTNYNYEMLNQRSSSNSNNQMTVDTHFRKKPKRLPSYIKLERAIDDDNSEDSTSTADSSESGVGGCGLKSRLKIMSGGSKKSMANCLRKVAKSVCGGHDNGDDESPNHRKNSRSVVNNTCGEANITGGSTGGSTESMSTK